MLWEYRLYWCIFTIFPRFYRNKLRWKDKFGTPRCEIIPQFRFEFLWFGFYGFKGDDDYWEQWLWIYKYNDGDKKKAKQTWPWKDYDSGKSNWTDYDII